MYKVGKDKKTLLETLKVVEKRTGRPPAELTEILSSIPEFPYYMEYLWEIFMRLNRERPIGLEPGRISHQQIESFCNLRRVHLNNFEIDAIQQLDQLALADPEKLSEQEKENENGD